MRLLLLLTVIFTVLAAVQARCDPDTQYELSNGQCCKMCGPGTSMLSLGTCQEPQCVECRKNEYQEKYTNEPLCQRQPYCDPNKNFLLPVHDTKKRSICLCKTGFHCSTDACISCVPHSTCGPGHGVKSKGNHTYDTVCEKCPDGTFSDEVSWEHACKKLTECGEGQDVGEQGTDTSDTICVTSSRSHLAVICVVVIIVVGLLVTAVLYWLCRAKRGDAKRKVKGCFESCLEEKGEPLRETGPVTTPTETGAEVSMLCELTSQQEEGYTRTAEEHDEASQEMSTDTGYTYNGNLVTQEDGKTELLSRQESQTQPSTD